MLSFSFLTDHIFCCSNFTHHVPLSGQLEEVFKHRPSKLSLLPFSVWSLHSQGPAQSQFERERAYLANQDWEGESVKVTHFCLVFFTFFCKHAQAHQNKVISVKNSSISLVCRDVSKYNRDPNHKTTPVGSAWINWNAKMAQMINTRSISRKDLHCD